MANVYGQCATKIVCEISNQTTTLKQVRKDKHNGADYPKTVTNDLYCSPTAFQGLTATLGNKA